MRVLDFRFFDRRLVSSQKLDFRQAGVSAGTKKLRDPEVRFGCFSKGRRCFSTKFQEIQIKGVLPISIIQKLQKMLAQNIHVPELKFMPFKGKGSKATQVPRKTLPAALTAYLPQRNSIIDWFYRAHSTLQFSKSTLFLGIALLDKLLTLKMPLADQKLQLVGASILLLVTKFNEVYPVSLRKLNALSSIDQSTEKYTEVEAQILETVSFDLSPEDPIYQELAQTEHKLGSQSQDIIKLAVKNPSISFKFGSPALLATLQSFFTGLSERKNESKVSSESAELRRELEKLRLGSSSSVKRMVSPSRA